MEGIVSEVVGTSIKLYALMTPPAVLSAFISGTKEYGKKQKVTVAFKTSTAIFIIGVVLYLFGSNLFELFGFTLDAFRIGSGVLLMLTAVALMNDDGSQVHTKREGDISVVPLAIPLGMGPASIGAVMVMGASAEDLHEMLVACFPCCWRPRACFCCSAWPTAWPGCCAALALPCCPSSRACCWRPLRPR